MGRSPSNKRNELNKGPWTPEEDRKLIDHIQRHGHRSWISLPSLAGLNRCGKSCRLRWINYLRPDIKRGNFTQDEDKLIILLHSQIGNKWARIATHLPGRTDNEIKNYWNTKLKKQLLQTGIDPVTHQPITDPLDIFTNLPQLLAMAAMNPSFFNAKINALRWQSNGSQESKTIHNILQLLTNNATNCITTLNQESMQNLQRSFMNDTPYSVNLPLYPCDQNIISSSYTNLGLGHEHHELKHGSTNLTMENLGVVQNDSLCSYDQVLGDIQGFEVVPPLMAYDLSRNDDDLKQINHRNSFSSTNMDAWENLIDAEASVSYWRNFMEQTSPSS